MLTARTFEGHTKMMSAKREGFLKRVENARTPAYNVADAGGGENPVKFADVNCKRSSFQSPQYCFFKLPVFVSTINC